MTGHGEHPQVLPADGRLIADYLGFLGYQGRSPKTIRRRKFSLSLFARWLAPTSLADATLDDIVGWASTYARPATRSAYISDLREFYKWAVKRGRLAVNPTVDLEGVRVPLAEARPVPPAGVAALLAASTDPATWLMVRLAVYAGLRVSEIAALEGADVDLGARVLRVRTSKMGHGRLVPIVDELAAALVDVPAGPLFSGVTAQGVSDRIKRLMERVGLGAYSAHKLRASFATQASRRVSVWTLRQMLGHASVATTQRYVLPDPGDVVALNGLHALDAGNQRREIAS